MYLVIVVPWKTFLPGEQIEVETKSEAAKIFVEKCLQYKIDIGDIIENKDSFFYHVSTLKKDYHFSIFLWEKKHLNKYQ